ncbi:putative membrane protein [Asticcacaulis biprosthecium C19]|uniref:Putative membrane protein n=1 Tax=Asticcacaulis biprosthecium C19 TaxID=715226 RepID=F4QK56_9CAUL|nr:hypothetical protein [Asticcacaulis biprosthecium]EGF92083.1 putative membrane protein [Asticcacaulis biprosthecium C19]
MNDIWNFFQDLSDGLNAALNGVNPLPVLIIGIIIGFLQPKPDRYLLKATLAVVAAFAIQAVWPALLGRPMNFPDFSRLQSIVQLFILLVIAYGTIGLLGSLKTALKFEGKKA